MRVGLLMMAMLVVSFLLVTATSAVDEKSRLAELDAYWAEVSRSVREGDFKAYEATCHPDGVLVAGTHDRCHPLAKALAKWKKEFDDTKAGTRKSNVTFRFSRRLGDATTAHETGIFLYEWSNDQGKGGKEYIHFEALLLKRGGAWKIMMENQKSKATVEQWNSLKK